VPTLQNQPIQLLTHSVLSIPPPIASPVALSVLSPAHPYDLTPTLPFIDSSNLNPPSRPVSSQQYYKILLRVLFPHLSNL
jgi:hypothetical protein